MSPGLGMSGSSQAPSLYDTMKHGNSAAYLENMESQLKMKEGKFWGETRRVCEFLLSELKHKGT